MYPNEWLCPAAVCPQVRGSSLAFLILENALCQNHQRPSQSLLSLIAAPTPALPGRAQQSRLLWTCSGCRVKQPEQQGQEKRLLHPDCSIPALPAVGLAVNSNSAQAKAQCVLDPVVSFLVLGAHTTDPPSRWRGWKGTLADSAPPCQRVIPRNLLALSISSGSCLTCARCMVHGSKPE